MPGTVNEGHGVFLITLHVAGSCGLRSPLEALPLL